MDGFNSVWDQVFVSVRGVTFERRGGKALTSGRLDRDVTLHETRTSSVIRASSARWLHLEPRPDSSIVVRHMRRSENPKRLVGGWGWSLQALHEKRKKDHKLVTMIQVGATVAPGGWAGSSSHLGFLQQLHGCGAEIHPLRLVEVHRVVTHCLLHAPQKSDRSSDRLTLFFSSFFDDDDASARSSLDHRASSPSTVFPPPRTVERDGRP